MLAALGDDVDDGARGLPELRLVAARQHLELGNRFLIELLRRSAVDGVLVRLPVNQKIVVAAPLAQHRIGSVAIRIGLPVDGHAGHELQQVEVVPAVDRQLGDLARRDGRARRGGRWIERRRAHGDGLLHAADLQRHVEGDDAVERHVERGRARRQARGRDGDRVGPGRQRRQAVDASRVGRGAALGGQRRADHA